VATILTMCREERRGRGRCVSAPTRSCLALAALLIGLIFSDSAEAEHFTISRNAIACPASGAQISQLFGQLRTADQDTRVFFPCDFLRELSPAMRQRDAAWFLRLDSVPVPSPTSIDEYLALWVADRSDQCGHAQIIFGRVTFARDAEYRPVTLAGRPSCEMSVRLSEEEMIWALLPGKGRLVMASIGFRPDQEDAARTAWSELLHRYAGFGQSGGGAEDTSIDLRQSWTTWLSEAFPPQRVGLLVVVTLAAGALGLWQGRKLRAVLHRD
jgi:hypothetical protein